MLRLPGRRRGRRKWPSVATREVDETHQGQRIAARGKVLLQARQTCLDRTVLMTRSIDAARAAPRNEPLG